MDSRDQQQQQPKHPHEKIKLVEINPYLTCHLCKGYLIDATTISECLHSFCRSCIIKFLQENCYCPICEVIINKAKPCLKLDKTLQDIVYKLVPELFTKEMHRRKQFYQFRPELAPKVSPEERGEDTERTIFNPQDAISLSIEYISDDSTPGAIPSLPTLLLPNKNVINTRLNNELVMKEKNVKSSNLNNNNINNNSENVNNNINNNNNNNNISDNPMKRYLQCPGMCRIEVLKKFVRNKYNVDTNLFHIDILYKRVPLPDHYTLIDIGYIYSWKRNEPMKFFFRITDINKVSERFDYFDSGSIKTPVKQLQQTSTPLKNHNHQHQITKQVNNKGVRKQPSQKLSSSATPSPPQQHQHQQQSVKKDKSEVITKCVGDNLPKQQQENISGGKNSGEGKKLSSPTVKKQSNVENISVEKSDLNNSIINKNNNNKTSEEIKTNNNNKVNNKQSDNKKQQQSTMFTNITLKRSDNLEIVTKIQKVSNKDGQPIGLNIINQTVKKKKVQNNSEPEKTQKIPPLLSPLPPPLISPPKNKDTTPSSKNTSPIKNKETTTTTSISNITKTIESVVSNSTNITTTTTNIDDDMESKSNFLKSIELTAKSNLPQLLQQKAIQNNKLKEMALTIPTPSTSSTQKRKNSSPIKHDTNNKKQKLLDDDINNKKQPMRIVIRPKSGQQTVTSPTSEPSIRQIMMNVNQNVNNMSKIVENSTNCNNTTPPSGKSSDLQSLIDNCKINIPSSLSITLNENGEGGARTPPSIPPVKNFIEILKLPENNEKLCEKTNGNGKLQSFQKIFEESLSMKKSVGGATGQNTENKVSNGNSNNSKRSILEIALKLQKKTKIENNTSGESNGGENGVGSSSTTPPKIAIPRLPTSKSPPTTSTTASMRSTSLGLNYTVSVDKKPSSGFLNNNNNINGNKDSSPTKKLSPIQSTTRPIKPKTVMRNNKPEAMSSQLLLEKYNIQNLAQLTASFPGGLTAATSSTPSGGGGTGGNNQFNALQHAMFLKHIEHQNWLNLNHHGGGSLMQYEKYLQNLNAAQNKILNGGGNNAVVKDN